MLGLVSWPAKLRRKNTQPFTQARRQLRRRRSCSRGTALRGPGMENRCRRGGFVDIKKAYFKGVPQRNIFMALPQGARIRQDDHPAHPVRVWHLGCCNQMGVIYRACLEELGLISGLASPCCFWHPQWKMPLVVHDDDFTSLGLDENSDKLEEGLERSMRTRYEDALGKIFRSKKCVFSTEWLL